MFFVATFGLFVNIIMVFLLGHHGHDHSHGHLRSFLSDHSHSGDQSNSHNHGDHNEKVEQGDVCSHDQVHEGLHVQNLEGEVSTPSPQEVGRNKGRNEQNNLEEEDKEEEESTPSPHELGRKRSYIVDIGIDTLVSPKQQHLHPGNINVRGAWLHVLGDLIQSIGVMIGGVIIWIKPEWKVVDLICSLLFSVLVLGTTIRILRDTVEILMESTPREIDVKKLEKELCEIQGVIAIHELHIWAITMGKTSLACHVNIYPDADADVVLKKVLAYCDQVFNISHVTVQIERNQGYLPP